MAPQDSDASSDETPGQGPGGKRPDPTTGQSVLVVAGAAVAGEELRSEVERHLAGKEAEIHVIAPSFTETRFQHHAGQVDDAVEVAKQRLDRSLEELRRLGVKVSGAIGDSDPTLAIDDALAVFPADEILVVTHPDEEAGWLEDEAFERAKERFDQPVVHVVVDHEGSDAHVTDVEEAAGERHDPAAEEPSARSWNLPPLSPRDVLGIFVAIVGTGILVVLAASCGESGGLEGHGPGFSGCDARLLIAIGIALISLAHVVGLVLFESVRYRGFWEKFFSRLSLIATPTAIVVSLLIA